MSEGFLGVLRVSICVCFPGLPIKLLFVFLKLSPPQKKKFCFPIKKKKKKMGFGIQLHNQVPLEASKGEAASAYIIN